jgi:hypothetical protein
VLWEDRSSPCSDCRWSYVTGAWGSFVGLQSKALKSSKTAAQVCLYCRIWITAVLLKLQFIDLPNLAGHLILASRSSRGAYTDGI